MRITGTVLKIEDRSGIANGRPWSFTQAFVLDESAAEVTSVMVGDTCPRPGKGELVDWSLRVVPRKRTFQGTESLELSVTALGSYEA
jgi:hypothetical protein